MKPSIIYMLTRKVRKQILLVASCVLFISTNAQTGSRLIGYGKYDYSGGMWYNVDSLKMQWLGNFGGDQDHADPWILTYRESVNSNYVSINYGYKDYYTYNANNLVVTALHLEWDGSIFQNYSRSTDSFDVQNRRVQTVGERWVGGTWVKSELYVYTFDSNNLVISADIKQWNTGTGIWQPLQIYTREYNAAGKTTLYQIVYWNGTSWVNSDKIEYVYDANNYLLTQTSYTGSGSTWINYQRFSHQYDVNNNETIYTYFLWNSPASAWKNVRRDLYTYNGNNLKIEWTEQTWSTVWDNSFKYFFTYTAAGQFETRTRQNWSGSWVNATKYLNTYNGNGFGLEDKTQIWDGVTWVDASRTTYVRNSFDQRTLTMEQTYAVGAWTTTSEKYNYYEAYSPVSGVDDLSATKNLKAYPNPFIQNCIIEFESSAFGKQLIQVFDLSGRLIKQTEEYFPAGTNNWLFDGKDNSGNEIAKGFYVVRIETVNEKFVQKITKM